MKTPLLILTVFLNLTVVCGQTQSPTVDCTNPLQAAEKLSKQIISTVQNLIKANKEYSSASFKDISKFDSYIECAKKNQGEDSQDAKKILELKNNVLKFTDMKNKEALVSYSDSIKNENNKKQMADMAVKTSCPQDKYKGGDIETIKNSIKNAWAKDVGCLSKYKILKIYVTTESWSKEKGYNYSKSSDTFKKYDESYLDVAVVFVPNDKPVIYKGTECPDVAQVFHYTIVKDNASGKINYVNFECHHLTGSSNDLLTASKAMYILKANVK